MNDRLLATLLLLAVGLWSAPLPAQAVAALTKANLDLPFEARGEDEEEDEPPSVIVFYNQQYEGDGVFFCCDKSGSMLQARKFQRLQQEVIRNIAQFTERVQFGIVLFDVTPSKFPVSGRPVEATPGMKASASSWILAARPGSGTCSGPALTAVLSFASQSSSKRKLIIFLSDGIQSCPGQGNQAQYGERCLAEATARNIQRVPINTICIGPAGQVDEDWMRKLAQQNQGQFARIVQ